MVFGKGDKLISIQKSLAAQVSDRLSAMDRANASTPNIFIAVNGQTCRRFPAQKFVAMWIKGRPNTADDASTGSLTVIG